MPAKPGDPARSNDGTLIGFPAAPEETPKAPPGVPAAGDLRAKDRTLLGVATAQTGIPRSATHVAALRPGAIVSDRYVLGDALVEGGMATIWAATDRATGRSVIVKSVHVRLSDNVEVLKRFEQEADIIAGLRSPHVVELLDRGVLAGAPYLVLERLEGEDLEVRLRRQRLPVGACVTLLDQVALALMPAHRGGVVHRDLKPANIFLAQTPGGEVAKLLDFGIAKLREGSLYHTAVGQTVGSPDFMSPEQMQGKGDLDGRSDLFALASVLYSCLTGKPPFTGRTIAHTFERTMAGDLVPPSKEAPDVPRRLDAFFVRALAFDRDARYPDAAAMAHAFRQFADEDRPSVSVVVETSADAETLLRPTLDPEPPPRPTVVDVEPPPPPRMEVDAERPAAAAPTAAAAAARARWPRVLAIAAVVAIAGVVGATLLASEDEATDRRQRPTRSRTEQVPGPRPLAPQPTDTPPRGR